eukprot:863959-Pelagomonas_calceolata.AAC.2
MGMSTGSFGPVAAAAAAVAAVPPACPLAADAAPAADAVPAHPVPAAEAAAAALLEDEGTPWASTGSAGGTRQVGGGEVQALWCVRARFVRGPDPVLPPAPVAFCAPAAAAAAGLPACAVHGMVLLKGSGTVGGMA